MLAHAVHRTLGGDRLPVEVAQQRNGTFSDFDGHDGDWETEVTADHDMWGIDDE